jgi:hypothetical protein
VAGEPLALRNDFVIVRIGGLPPFDFLRNVGIEIVTKELALDPVAESVGA